MNYNDQYRSSHRRILNNYNRGERGSCGCSHTSETQRNSSCSCSRPSEPQRNTNCGCNNTTELTIQHPCTCSEPTREIKVTPFPTACTTTPVTESCVDTYPNVMAYVPMQEWRELYDPSSGLHRGTIFRELDLEWYPTNCRKDCRRGNN